MNWFGLIPGIGTVGWGHYDAAGNFHVNRPLFRGGNADLNMTTAMSAIFFVHVVCLGDPGKRRRRIPETFVRAERETSGIIKILMIVIFFAVGWLEVISILFRPIALSFRLFGNIYAGESILEAMSTMVPWLSPIPIPFYFLEVLVGFVQALVFMLLTAVFTMLIAEHEGTGTRTLDFRFGDPKTRSQNQVKNMILPILAELSGSIHVGLAAMGVGIGIGLTGLGMTSAVGRNPGAFTQVLVHGILAIALTEAIVFYALYLVH